MRLATSARLRAPVLGKLLPPDLMDDLAEIEGATSGRPTATTRGADHIDAREFVDLRGHSSTRACLHPDPAVGYQAGNAIADAARGAGHNGVIYPSVRHPGGTCIVALKGALYRLFWRGSRDPSVEPL